MTAKNVQPVESFANLVRLNWTLSTTGDRVADNPVLEEIGTPILLLDSEGRLVYTNHAAAMLLRQADGLQVHTNTLLTMSPQVTARLHSSVRSAISNGRIDSFAIPRRSGRLPYVIKLSRVIITDSFCLAILVDPDANVAPEPEMLIELFELTHAEARLAVALARGDTVTDFANQFHIKVSTVRSHLRTVFAKTGTSRQSDLIRVLLTIGMRLQTP